MEEGGGGVTKLLFSFSVVLCALIACTHAIDTISANQTIRDDGETIVSAQETFELGFFSPQNSTNRYVGIWYNKISTGTVVWVANRNTPITDASGELTLTSQGMVIRNVTGNVVWSSGNSSAPPVVTNPVGQLLDSGNLIIREEADSSSENPVWESFDFPTDTFLPGMKFGRNLVTGLDMHTTSWKSNQDPSLGEFTVWIDTNGYPQLILKDGPKIRFRAGPWNGLRFSGEPNLSPNQIYRFGFVLNKKEIYYHYDLINASVVTMIVTRPSGTMERVIWIDSRQEWSLYLTTETDSCDRYALCGVFGSCNISNSPACECLEGFEPTLPDQWNVGDWSHGCQRRTALSCGPGDGFRKYSSLKLPDTQGSWFDQNMNLEECERLCKNNCSCTAYTNQNITGGGSGCLLWFGDLIDTRTFSGNGQDLYIRLAALELEKDKKVLENKKKVWIIVIPVVVGLTILLGICVLIIRKRKQQAQGRRSPSAQKHVLDLPLFSLSSLLVATNNFSDDNKLGEGGFGPVYKGFLEDGREVAVKRLSESSTQGVEEFKNEVIFISKLQHRNLVKILGFCIEGEEKMLVYEYMPNKGLDLLLFQSNSEKLNWPQRFHIINGVARGLLYLHQDSRLRIIHRDLKAANILLDRDMNPKIADFGIARSFGENETVTNTNRVVGTYGYMSPEYARDGTISVKSDVFSFGVMVLEIVSGKKNRRFVHKDHIQNLLGHAWRLHREGKTLELVDASLVESSHKFEVLQSIQVGLLCVQHSPNDRPNMSMVVAMLGSKSPLPEPKHPGFYIADSSGSQSTVLQTQISINEVTLTLLEAR